MSGRKAAAKLGCDAPVSFLPEMRTVGLRAFEYVIAGNKFGDVERIGIAMLVKVADVCVTNVWQEQFTDRKTGEVVTFCRALLSKVGEPPTQLSVQSGDYEDMCDFIGGAGNALIEIEARPGQRVRAYFKGLE